MSKYKIIALYGESGAGKDTIQNWLVDLFPEETNKIISCTTRPPREHEENGKDYYFIDPAFFAQKILDGSMLEAVVFNEWGYGTPIDSLEPDKINIGVFNPAGIEALLEDPRLEVEIIYIQTTPKERLLRTLNREDFPDCHEICRRFLADERDFDDIDFVPDRVWHNNFMPIASSTLIETLNNNCTYFN